QIRLAAREQTQRWREDDFVFREVLGRSREIDGNVPVVQRVVEKLDVFALLEVAIRLLGKAQMPIVFVTHENARLSGDARSLQHWREPLQLLTDLLNLFIDAIVR